MSKAVLISIHPEWCEKIVSGQKTIEVRKTRPKIESPFKCYIYQTKHRWLCSFLYHLGKKDLADYLESAHSKVIGEFICDRIHEFQVFENGSVQDWWFENLDKSCLDYNEVADYIGRNNRGYSWHISNLVIYDKPKELNEFHKHCIDSFSCELCVLNENNHCENEGLYLTRPPQSWCYVEKIA